MVAILSGRPIFKLRELRTTDPSAMKAWMRGICQLRAGAKPYDRSWICARRVAPRKSACRLKSQRPVLELQ